MSDSPAVPALSWEDLERREALRGILVRLTVPLQASAAALEPFIMAGTSEFDRRHRHDAVKDAAEHATLMHRRSDLDWILEQAEWCYRWTYWREPTPSGEPPPNAAATSAPPAQGPDR